MKMDRAQRTASVAILSAFFEVVSAIFLELDKCRVIYRDVMFYLLLSTLLSLVVAWACIRRSATTKIPGLGPEKD